MKTLLEKINESIEHKNYSHATITKKLKKLGWVFDNDCYVWGTPSEWMRYDKNGKWLEDNWNDKNMWLKYCLTYRKDEGFEIMFAINDDKGGLTGTKGWMNADGETFYEFWNNLTAIEDVPELLLNILEPLRKEMLG